MVTVARRKDLQLHALNELEKAERAEQDARVRARRQAVARFVEGAECLADADRVRARGRTLQAEAVQALRAHGLSAGQVSELVGLSPRGQATLLRDLGPHLDDNGSGGVAPAASADESEDTAGRTGEPEAVP
jgi:hypothetical protein